MALGATRGSVLGMILGQGMRLTIVGLVAGLVASFGLTRLLQAQLFNVKPTDPATLTAVAALHRRHRVRRVLRAGAARDARRSDGDAAGVVAGRVLRSFGFSVLRVLDATVAPGLETI